MSKLVQKGSWLVREGFTIEQVVTGLELPVNIAFVSRPKKEKGSPLFYVTELYGSIKVVTKEYEVKTFAGGLLNYEPDSGIPGTGESGVIGIAVDKKGDVYASMLYADGDKYKSKVVKYTSWDGMTMDKEEVLIDGIPSINPAHQVKALTIREDKLFVNVGDGMIEPDAALDEKDLRGKILRMNLDGSIPKDNPDPESYVYAKGLRNPFGAAWNKETESLYISDNGPAVDDRVARILPGEDYGWPRSMRKNSIFVWRHTEAPTAMDFAGSQFGADCRNHLFVALFGSADAEGVVPQGKKIVEMVVDDRDNVTYLADFLRHAGDGPASCFGLAFGPGGMYFTDLRGDVGLENDPEARGNIWKVKKEK